MDYAMVALSLVACYVALWYARCYVHSHGGQDERHLLYAVRAAWASLVDGVSRHHVLLLPRHGGQGDYLEDRMTNADKAAAVGEYVRDAIDVYMGQSLEAERPGSHLMLRGVTLDEIKDAARPAAHYASQVVDQ